GGGPSKSTGISCDVLTAAEVCDSAACGAADATEPNRPRARIRKTLRFIQEWGHNRVGQCSAILRPHPAICLRLCTMACMPDRDAPIGVFDSGVGGLSVLREIRRELPAEHLLYVADSGYAPYGERPPAFIQQRAEALLAFLERHGAKAVVVACNTATGVAVDELRARTSTPIVAIEPAVKPATVETKSGVIGV